MLTCEYEPINGNLIWDQTRPYYINGLEKIQGAVLAKFGAEQNI